jgi:hypothetical protein
MRTCDLKNPIRKTEQVLNPEDELVIKLDYNILPLNYEKTLYNCYVHHTMQICDKI